MTSFPADMACWDQVDAEKRRCYPALLAEVDWTLDTFNYL